MATHSSILAWRILWTEEPSKLQSMGSQELDMTQALNHHCVKLLKFVGFFLWESSYASIFLLSSYLSEASQVVLVVKNSPANAGDIRDVGLIPGLERSLEEGLTTQSSFLDCPWTIPWPEEPAGLQKRQPGYLSKFSVSYLSHSHFLKGKYNNKSFLETFGYNNYQNETIIL